MRLIFNHVSESLNSLHYTQNVYARSHSLEKRLLRVPSSCLSSVRMFQLGSHRTDINNLCLLYACHRSSGCRYNQAKVRKKRQKCYGTHYLTWNFLLW